MDKNNTQYVQPEISRSKFESEVKAFQLIESEYRKRGIICLKVEFPVIQFAFVAHLLKPPAVVFAVSIDFTNYDVEPPSIIFINVFTGEPVTTKEVYAKFIKIIQPNQVQAPDGMVMPFQLMPNIQPILIGEPNEQPFLCIPGVREYHNHPLHTGNPWLLSRGRGEGTLAFLIEQLYMHSIPYIKSYSVNHTVGINIQI